MCRQLWKFYILASKSQGSFPPLNDLKRNVKRIFLSEKEKAKTRNIKIMKENILTDKGQHNQSSRSITLKTSRRLKTKVVESSISKVCS